MTRLTFRKIAIGLAVIIILLVMRSAALPVYATTSLPFRCGTADVCNLHRDQPDEYCTSEHEPRCKSCSSEVDRCFTERMAFNCTNYCRGKSKYIYEGCSERSYDYVEEYDVCWISSTRPPITRCSAEKRRPYIQLKAFPESSTNAQNIENEIDRRTVLGKEKERVCVDLGNITNGYHNASDKSTPGDTIQITCDIGYRVEGSDIIRCLEYGIWSDGLPNCTEIHRACTRKPFIAHGKVVGDNNVLRNGEAIIRFRCDTGYKPSVGRAICQEDGTWLSAVCYMDLMPETWFLKYESIWITRTVMAAVVPITLMLLHAVCLFTCKPYRHCLSQIKCCNPYGDNEHINKSKSGYLSTPRSDDVCAFDDSEATCRMYVCSDEQLEQVTQRQQEKQSIDRRAQSGFVTDQVHQCQTFPAEQFCQKINCDRPTESSLTETTDIKTIPSLDVTPPRNITPPSDNTRSDIVSNSVENGRERLSFNIGKLKVNINVNRHVNRDQDVHTNIQTTSPQHIHTDRGTIPDPSPYPTQASDEGYGVTAYLHHPSARSDNFVEPSASANNSGEQKKVMVDNSSRPIKATHSEEPFARPYNSNEPSIVTGNSDNDNSADTDAATTGLQLHPVEDSSPGMLALASNTVALSDIRRTRRR